MVHATIDRDAMDFQDPDYIREDEGPLDVDFDQVATAEEEDLPGDNVASWTTYHSGGDDDSSLSVRHDSKLPVLYNINLHS